MVHVVIMATSTKKRSFDAKFKLEVVDYAMQNTNRSASRKFGVYEKRVRESLRWKRTLLPGLRI